MLDVFDVDLLSQAVAGSGLEHRQIGRGPFRGWLRRQRIGALLLDSGRYSQALQSRGAFARDAVVIGCILDELEAGCINGHRFGRHDLVVFPAGADMDYLVPAETQWVAVQAPASLLVESGIDPDALAQVAVHSGTRPANAALANRLRSLVGAEREGRCGLAAVNREPGETIGALTELIGRALERQSERRVARRCSFRKHATLIRRFEEALHDADSPAMPIPALLSGLGVSQRTLEYVFRAHLGISPKRYAALIRLNQIQRELLRATPEITTIAEVARRHGIRQLGRFSAEYRRQFGELPSETLRRAR